MSLLLCRSEADLVGDQPADSSLRRISSPYLQNSSTSRFLETHGYAGSAFGIRIWTPRVGAIGSSAALIITTRETRSLSWDSVPLSYPPTEDPHRRTPFGASPFFFWRPRTSRYRVRRISRRFIRILPDRYYRVICQRVSFILNYHTTPQQSYFHSVITL